MKEADFFVLIAILFVLSIMWLILGYRKRKLDSRTIIIVVQSPEDFDERILDAFFENEEADTLKVKKSSSPPR